MSPNIYPARTAPLALAFTAKESLKLHRIPCIQSTMDGGGSRGLNKVFWTKRRIRIAAIVFILAFWGGLAALAWQLVVY